ncbi:MAG: ChaN family lipoprotein [Thermoanaerobaculia bacterium]
MSAPRPRLVPLLLTALVLSGGCARAPHSDLAAVVDGLFALWEEADLVCLGEEHGSRADADLRLALIADPRFAHTVDVVLLEAASPLHQDLLDRFVVEGEELDREALRPIWLDSGLGEFWESPVYEGLLRALRRLNRDLPAGERVRVVAGAVPVQWDRVQAAADLVPYLDRRPFFAERARRDVLDRGLSGLAVYGVGHCAKDAEGFPSALPAAARRRVRSVLPITVRPDSAAGLTRLAPGPAARLLTLRGSAWSGEPAMDFGFAAGTRTLDEIADALVWHGEAPDEILAPRPGELPVDWRAELDRRARLWQEAKALPPPA